jgi:hypothetical protein
MLCYVENVFSVDDRMSDSCSPAVSCSLPSAVCFSFVIFTKFLMFVCVCVCGYYAFAVLSSLLSLLSLFALSFCPFFSALSQRCPVCSSVMYRSAFIVYFLTLIVFYFVRVYSLSASLPLCLSARSCFSALCTLMN